ncbi:hypothetical protein DKP76_10020 [Falsochrobactrum shanghaiense]|uniref:Uncharacterized protein n=1 Tax=Falsochrobactrum shanghaiense TaxID=2201899 RepID=A0A316J813_9HYPH|nr:hypothetical protein DKP76_10020 [Falsochrobactrum shanghaiense]
MGRFEQKLEPLYLFYALSSAPMQGKEIPQGNGFRCEGVSHFAGEVLDARSKKKQGFRLAN